MYLPRKISTDLVAHILRENCSTAKDIEHYDRMFETYFKQTVGATDQQKHVETLIREALAVNDNINLAAALSIAAALDPVPVEEQD